jgi:L-fuculose-phosphate aldolase
MSIKSDLIYFSKLCHRNKFVSASDGNLSVRTRKNFILITAANTFKGRLGPKDLVKVDFKGRKIQGKKEASTEIKLHKFIYQARKDVNAIVHTHPVFSTAFAAAGLAIDKVVYPEIYIKFGKVPLAKYATPSTEEVPESISKYVKNYDAILLANHGLVTFGIDLEDAYHKTEKIEHIARTSFYARQLGGERALTKAQVKKLEKIKNQKLNIKKQNLNLSSAGFRVRAGSKK